jgi:antibiotic biosynthesis monooxygenase (ABM) superfamily enzyme
MKYDDIWYATPRRADSRTKLIVYDEVGSLIVEGAQFAFQGTKTNITLRRIEFAVLVGQKANLITYLIVSLIVLPWSLFIAYVMHSLFNCTMVVVLLLCYSVVPVGLAIGASTRWIKVSFVTDSGECEQAYFADGTAHGWGGIFGGTRRMFAELRSGLSV